MRAQRLVVLARARYTKSRLRYLTARHKERIMTRQALAQMIDHTQLSPLATTADIERLCDEARRFGFANVCVNPCYVATAHDLLVDSEVKTCTVIGFPLGAEATADKAAAARNAVASGADEIDMVVNLGLVKEGDFEAVEDEIHVVVEDCRAEGRETGKTVTVKVILETCYLTDDEVTESALAALRAGADFVKTSTGLASPKAADGSPLPNGATVHHVTLLAQTVGGRMGIKASGGIRTTATARALIEAGATRLGTSSAPALLDDWQAEAARDEHGHGGVSAP